MAVFDSEGARIVQRRTSKQSKKQTDTGAAVALEEEGRDQNGEGGQRKLTETVV